MLYQPQLAAAKPLIHSEQIRQLPQQLQRYQAQFAITGGVHSAALVNPDGEIL